MKRELALTGIALLVSVLLSSPTFADPAKPTAKATLAPAPIEATAPAQAEELSLDDAILLASTPQERAAVLRRCAGPPPHIAPAASHEAPASEPALVSE